MRRVAAALLLLVLCGCCADTPDRTTAVDFGGVRGRIWLERPCPDGCDEWDPAEGLVVARAEDSGYPARTVQLVADGSFELPLAPGRYAIEVAANGHPIDRTLSQVDIGERDGVFVERTYEDWWEPRGFTVDLAPGVSPTRVAEIFAGYQVSFISADSLHVVTPPGTHVEIEIERLRARYPDEILAASPNSLDCAG